jgi:hypothetical protein
MDCMTRLVSRPSHADSLAAGLRRWRETLMRWFGEAFLFDKHTWEVQNSQLTWTRARDEWQRSAKRGLGRRIRWSFLDCKAQTL